MLPIPPLLASIVPMPLNQSSAKQTTKVTSPKSLMKMMMAPSSGEYAESRESIVPHRSLSSLDEGYDLRSDGTLRDFPAGISPNYGPIPWIYRGLTYIGSIIVSSWIRVSSWGELRKLSVRAIFEVVGRAIVMAFISTIVVQDLFFAPTRVTTEELIELPSSSVPTYGNLPSKYSVYEPIQVFQPLYNIDRSKLNLNDSVSFGTHYLRYKKEKFLVDDLNDSKYDVLHYSHGFGASSLSWLPCFRLLVEKTSDVGLAHDAIGFGLTERPALDRNAIDNYSLEKSAALGTSLVLRETSLDANKSILLLGHSMGAIAALRSALNIRQSTLEYPTITIVLVSPAIFATSKVSPSDLSPEIRSKQNVVQKWRGSLRKILFDSPIAYILRRLVSSPSFWRKGLSGAWGDPDRLRDEDILRFRWPAIAKNLETGLLAFARSQMSRYGKYPGGDVALLRDVLDMPNVNLSIIHGTKDSIVPLSNSKKLELMFGTKLKVYEMNGLGHDAFEEDAERFVELVSSIV